jgi:hypothetical protein
MAIFMDFSRYRGFEERIYESKKQYSLALKAPFTSWNSAFCEMRSLIDGKRGRDRHILLVQTILPWKSEQWKVYHAVKEDTRIAIAPVLNQLDISYHIYREWKKTLADTCSILTEFYPAGVGSYLNYVFLIQQYNRCMEDLLTCIPTTVTVTRTDDDLVASVKVAHSNPIRELLIIICSMKSTGYERVHSAFILKGCYHTGCPSPWRPSFIIIFHCSVKV